MELWGFTSLPYCRHLTNGALTLWTATRLITQFA